MYTIQEMSKTSCADVYILTNVTACCAFCDVGHATIGLTNLANCSIRFLYSFISF